MILVVTGGRKFTDKDFCWEVLDDVHANQNIELLVHGDAGGWDRLCRDWARDRGVPEKGVAADWKNITREGAVVRQGQYGPYDVTAGFVRNQDMAENYGATACLAGPGGTGTADMVERCDKAGVRVWYAADAIF